MRPWVLVVSHRLGQSQRVGGRDRQAGVFVGVTDAGQWSGVGVGAWYLL